MKEIRTQELNREILECGSVVPWRGEYKEADNYLICTIVGRGFRKQGLNDGLIFKRERFRHQVRDENAFGTRTKTWGAVN